MRRTFKLFDKQEQELLGPFNLTDIEAVVTRESKLNDFCPKAVIKKDNRIIEIDEIGPRYLVETPDVVKCPEDV